MPSKEELKKELHTLIDSIEDENTLNVLHEEVAAYAKEADQATDEQDGLTNEQWSQLQQSIKEADEGQTVTEEEYIKATARWRTK